MIPVIPIVLVGGALISMVGKRRRKRWVKKAITLKSALAGKSTLAEKEIQPRLFSDLPFSIRAYFSLMDRRYQNLIQTRFDPKLIGSLHNQQIVELAGGALRGLSPQEKKVNRNLLFGATAFVLSLLTYLTAWPFAPLIFLMAAYCIWPLARECWHVAFRERRLSLLHLVLIYFGCMLLSGYFAVGTIAIVFFNLNRKSLFLSKTVTRHSLTHLLGEQPQKVWVFVDDVEIEIPFEKLRVGDILVLNAGQPVPVDGVVVQGAAVVDQHRLTGESQPVEKTLGDTIFAATLVLGGQLQVRVAKTGEETIAAKIGAVLNRTIEYQEIRTADMFRHLEWTLWPLLTGSAAGWLVGGPVTATAILGCNYLTATVPLKMLALLNSLKTGAEQGVLVKDGRALEQLPGINTIVFDKTGTLTLEQPRVEAIHCAAGYDENKILTLAATAERHQNHPIAQAILSEAANRQLDPLATEDAHYEIGLGLTVSIRGQSVHIGSERFLKTVNITLPASLNEIQTNVHEHGNILVFVAVDTEVAGAIELAATLRPETPEVIDWFKQKGIKLFILSGDQEAPTRKLAQELGMDGYFANTLPEQKAKRVRELQTQGHRVCFIGDGINDAIALHQAEVSISLRGATTVATDAAQIILMKDHLKQLILLWELARGFESSVATNNRLARRLSLAAVTGVMVLPFKFWIVELLFGVQAVGGIKNSYQPLIEHKKSEKSDLLNLKEESSKGALLGNEND